MRDDLTIMDEKIFESLFIEIKCEDKSVLYGTIYRSSSSNDKESVNSFFKHLKNCLSKIEKSNKLCFIQGDFNFDLMDIDNTYTTDFTDIMFQYSFYSHINKPTRVIESTARCLDHIWSNIYDKDIHSGIVTASIAAHMCTFQCSDININSDYKKNVTKGMCVLMKNLTQINLLMH